MAGARGDPQALALIAVHRAHSETDVDVFVLAHVDRTADLNRPLRSPHHYRFPNGEARNADQDQGQHRPLGGQHHAHGEGQEQERGRNA